MACEITHNTKISNSNQIFVLLNKVYQYLTSTPNFGLRITQIFKIQSMKHNLGYIGLI